MSNKPKAERQRMSERKAAQLADARTLIDYEANAARLRAYHVRSGHTVKDLTDAELVVWTKARAAKAK